MTCVGKATETFLFSLSPPPPSHWYLDRSNHNLFLRRAILKLLFVWMELEQRFSMFVTCHTPRYGNTTGSIWQMMSCQLLPDSEASHNAKNTNKRFRIDGKTFWTAKSAPWGPAHQAKTRVALLSCCVSGLAARQQGPGSPMRWSPVWEADTTSSTTGWDKFTKCSHNR